MKTDSSALALPVPAPLPESAALFKKLCIVTDHGLDIKEGTTFEEWRTLGGFLNFLGGNLQWMIGDYLAFGERNYGEQYTETMKLTGKSYKTLANTLWVVNKFPKPRRHDSLTFAHHVRVARLPVKQQDALLKKAEKEQLSVTALRKLVKDSDGTPAPVTNGNHNGLAAASAIDSARAVLAFIESPAYKKLAMVYKRDLLEVLAKICAIACK